MAFSPDTNLSEAQTLFPRETTNRLSARDLKDSIETAAGYMAHGGTFEQKFTELYTWANFQPKARMGIRHEAEVRAFFTNYKVIVDDTLASADFKAEKDIKERKLGQAKINQRIVQALYTTSQLPSGDSSRDSAKYVFSVASALAHADNAFGKEVIAIMNGARSQVAAMRELNKLDYQVVVPDYDNDEEVLVWDVYSGADFVAVSKDGKRIILVDTVSNINESDPTFEQTSTLPEKYKKTNEGIILNSLKSMDNPPTIADDATFEYHKITMPTDTNHVSSLGEANQFVSRKFVEHYQQK